MKKYLEKLTELYQRLHLSDSVWRRARSVTAFVLVFVTTYSLIIPAITLDNGRANDMAGLNLPEQSRGDLSCHFVVHTHTDACYTEQPVYDEDSNQTGTEKVLSCGKADWAVHQHDENCYRDGQLICQLPEYEEHVHDASCYETQKVLTCEKEETTGHQHTDACYEEHVNNVCGIEEHKHGEECYETDPDTGGLVLACGLEEHVHSEACYETEKELVCGQEEREGHTHTNACYTEEKVLICDKLELHTHNMSCFETGPNGESPVEMGWVTLETDENGNEILCGDPAHLVCGKVELLKHQHDDSCFLPPENTDDGMYENDVAESGTPEGTALENNTEGGDVPENSADDPADNQIVMDPAADENQLDDIDIVTDEDAADAENRGKIAEDTDDGGQAASDEAQNGKAVSGSTDAEESRNYSAFTRTVAVDGASYSLRINCSEASCIPEDAEFRATAIAANRQDYDAYRSRALEAVDNYIEDEAGHAEEMPGLFDLSIFDKDGNEIQPAAPLSVSIDLGDAIAEDARDVYAVHFPGTNIDTTMTPAATNPVTKAAQVISAKISGTGTEVIETTDGKNGAVQFEAESLSVYAIVYTVDFHWEVDGKKYDFSIPGGGFVSFEHIVEVLGIGTGDTNRGSRTEATEVSSGSYEQTINLNEAEVSESTKKFVSEVESVEFSDSKLVWAGKVDEATTVGELKEVNGLKIEYSKDLTKKQINKINAQTVEAGDWALISTQPFSSEEALTVTMKNGDVFKIRVTDANVAKEDVQDGKGYILFTRGSDNNYYVLKADGTTQRFDNADGFDELTNEYKWTVTHVYTENELERFNIHSYTDPSHSLALNSPGKSLLASGANNIIVNPSGDGYTFTGYNDTKLGLTQDGGSKKFAGVTSDPAVMYFYEQTPLTSYKFTVTSNDIKRGKLVGRDNVGVMQGETQDCAQYTTGTTADKKNQYTIKAVPQSNKYIFDHWELNGVKISAGSTINPEELDIPYNGSSLEAIFKVNPDYNASDDEKEGQGFDNASKAELQAWLNELKSRQVPLNPDGCKKTAEVYDYDNRIYRVDLTAQSSLTTFDGVIDLGFIMDVSGSMQFPSKLSPVSGKESYYINQINDYGHQNDLAHDKYYYLIADKAGTATVYRLFYGSQQEQTWYGTTTRTGWWAVDASYKDNDSRHFFIGSDSRFSNDTAGMNYQIYTDGDNGKRRLDYLISSVNGTVGDLRTILDILALAGSETQNPDVKIAYNTFYSSVNTKQHEFISATDFNEGGINWATNGGTATDAAIADARDFGWGTVNAGTKNYAILITDGAPQAGGKAIANQTVINQANELKKGPDGISGTADDVTLITVGLSMGDVKRGSVLLYDLADRDSDNEKLFFKAESGDELEYALYQILQKIMVDASVQGKVTDTVGDAFYPVDLETGVQLTAGNVINLSGVCIGQTEAGLTDEQRAAGYGVIQEDGKTIVWTNQEFTHEGWHGTVYVKAKEDFLGGNAVRTNSGDASIEAESYKTLSMTEPIRLRNKKPTDNNYILKVEDLKSPLVNVNELSFTQNETEWTVYLGTEVDPEKQLEALYKKILVEQKVTEGQDLEPEEGDNLKDHVTGGKGNYLYPLKQSISDKRESEIEDGKRPVTFTMNDLLKKLVAGKDYSWWDYTKGEPKYKEFFEATSTGDGITLDYDEYGINEKEHKLDDNTSKRDGSTINIKLTPVIKQGELDAGVDPLNGPHATKITGDAVEKYTLSIVHTPDYEILPEGQGGKSVEDFHDGSFATMYHGHAAGKETSTNVHTINVYTKPLEVKKVDPDGATLEGAKFGIYRPAEAGETGVSLSRYNSELTGNYVLVSEGTSDGTGIVRLANTGSTEATLLVPGKDYILIETEAPAGYERDDSVRHVQVTAESNGKYTDLDHKEITNLLGTFIGNLTGNTAGNLAGYEGPYNWSQGVRISVDGKVIVAAEAPSGSDDGERELGANEQAYKTDPVVFRTTIVNKKNTTTLDVTKNWVDDKGKNVAQPGHAVTFKVTRKAEESGTPEDVSLTGHITAKEGISVSNDGSTVTITYQEDTGWPTARITGLDKYTDSSMQTAWIYEVTETICNPTGKVDPAKAKYEMTEVNGIQTITIVNIEKKTTQINVDKKWFGADGKELSEAPENSITFEVYRVAHIPCIHNYENQEWVTETEPTCTETGRKYRECSKCHEKEYATIPANGHSWSEWTVRTPATYAADGEEVRTCSVCEKEETRLITKLPHDHVYDELDYITEPTCTEGGTAHRKCSLCGELAEEIIEIPKLGHSWDDGKVTKAATCEEPGTKSFTCTRPGCGATESRAIAALGHDWVYEDDPVATCTEAGTRKWTCRNDSSHHDDKHPASETIAALGHQWGEWETYIEATETTAGENRRYCQNDPSHYESQVVPKTGETFGDTGLPVSPYEWPYTPPAGVDGNTNTNIKPTGIIKCVHNGTVTYAIIYKECNPNYNQLAEGPGGSALQNEAVVLTGTIKTKADIKNNTISPIAKGDLFQTDDGEYYVFLKNDGAANNLNNGFNSGDWYHIPKPTEESGANGTNANTNSLNSAGRRMLLASPKAMKMRAVTSSLTESEDVESPAKGATRAADQNAERKARIAALMNTTEDQIIFRSELGEQSNVDVWEYVNEYTGSGTDWSWALENLDAYDDDGNEYIYYVVETAPDTSLYEITYDGNGIKDSGKEKTITIKNKQKVGSVEVTKTFAGLPVEKIPHGFKIVATYTEKGEQKTVELTASTEGVTGDGIREPFRWTINNLPLGTVVTFTESGYEVLGYAVVTNPASDDNVVSATATAAETPGQARFINTYTEDAKVTLDILKVENDKPDKKLENAVFTLWEINSGITASKPSHKNPDDRGIQVTTDSQGKASFSDLKTGYYEIRETGIPAGYVATGDAETYIRVANGKAEMIKVNVAGDGWETVSSAGNFEFAAASETDNAKLTVSNEPGAALPNTGGPGTRLFTILGLTLALGAGVLLWRKRRTI